MCVGIENKSP